MTTEAIKSSNMSRFIITRPDTVTTLWDRGSPEYVTHVKVYVNASPNSSHNVNYAMTQANDFPYNSAEYKHFLQDLQTKKLQADITLQAQVPDDTFDLPAIDFRIVSKDHETAVTVADRLFEAIQREPIFADHIVAMEKPNLHELGRRRNWVHTEEQRGKAGDGVPDR